MKCLFTAVSTLSLPKEIICPHFQKKNTQKLGKEGEKNCFTSQLIHRLTEVTVSSTVEETLQK